MLVRLDSESVAAVCGRSRVVEGVCVASGCLGVALLVNFGCLTQPETISPNAAVAKIESLASGVLIPEQWQASH